ncbi:MAG: ABC transporter ATP-binding protein [Anaerolineae bacterium]
MSDIAIRVENVSKYYRLGLIGGGTLHDDFERWWAKVRGKPDPLLKIGQEDHGHRQGEYIWALRDVSFEVQQGEVLGIIGRNGAGKSTLLKILSRVTAPTSGQVKIKGRVASLLEVGTGFHPELTGRENIYLNGAILGMKKAEIERKFDEIVAFAEIEKFIDTPVKRYSSGMYVRLAFAVAAHLEPEILLVDEVLAVGDAAFQKKCLGKMEEVGRQGRTVLFVSHNMSAITRLCPQSIWLENGRIKDILPSGQAVAAYLADGAREQPEVFFPGDMNKEAQYLAIRVLNGQYVPSAKISCDESFSIQLSYVIRKRDAGVYFAFYLQNVEGLRVIFSDSRDDTSMGPLVPGVYQSTIEIPPRLLAPGRYFVTAGIATGNGSIMLDHQPQVCGFSLHDVTSVRGDNRPGLLGIMLKWDTREYSLPTDGES